jgi:hypothetical protein
MGAFGLGAANCSKAITNTEPIKNKKLCQRAGGKLFNILEASTPALSDFLATCTSLLIPGGVVWEGFRPTRGNVETTIFVGGDGEPGPGSRATPQGIESGSGRREFSRLSGRLEQALSETVDSRRGPFDSAGRCWGNPPKSMR